MVDDYIRAMERERSAWKALNGRLPGMAGSSSRLYGDWIDAVAELNELAERYIAGLPPRDPPKPEPKKPPTIN
ncbi:MAG: hypothetical protein ACAH21_07845 [Ramlibacter sp.]